MADFQNKDDHDILIELRTVVTTFTQQYAKDMLELKNGTSSKLADHEVRLRALEVMTEKVDPMDKVKRLLVLEDSVHDFFTRLSTARWTIGAIGGAVGAILIWLFVQLPTMIKNISNWL